MTIIYHASPLIDLPVIDPSYSTHKKVFAAKSLDMAYSFLGRAGRGYVIQQRRENPSSIPILRELVSGGFEHRYRNVPGAIYELDSNNFVPGGWESEEVVSSVVETPLGSPTIISDVREQLLRMAKNREIVIEWWTGPTDDKYVLNYWFGLINNPKLVRLDVTNHARDFFHNMRPHLSNTFEKQLIAR